MEQTAVEWLESKMPIAFKNLTINKQLIEQAKLMEQEQLRNERLEGYKEGIESGSTHYSD